MTWTKPKASSAKRGYGYEHRSARKRWALVVQAGKAHCCLCGRWIAPDSKWHLDHTPDRTGYRGVACVTCNLSDAGKRARARQGVTRLRW